MLFKVTLTTPRTGSSGRKTVPRIAGYVVEATTGGEAVQTLIEEQPHMFNPVGITHTVAPWTGRVVALP